jgi:hypothetical protein
VLTALGYQLIDVGVLNAGGGAPFSRRHRTPKSLRMTLVPPGWHPDPANPAAQLRWWDGSSWTDRTAPNAVYAPAAAPAVPQRVLAARPTAGIYQLNKTTVTVLGVVAGYLVLAAATHIVLLGIFPVSMSFTAARRREPLAFVAVIAALASVAVAVGTLMR